MNVSILPSTDPQLIELVRSCGAQVTVLTLEDLSALARESARQPSVIVIDQRDRSTMPAELSAITRCHPTTGILMVLPRLEGALVLEAMRAGVNECVADPVTREDLNAALQRIAAQRPPAERGEVFAVVGAKGGVGATTIAVNLAAMLHKLRPTSTLLMDLHLTYGDAGLFLGSESRFSTADALDNVHRMDAMFLRSLVTQTRAGLHLLASSNHHVTPPVDAKRIRGLIELVSHEFRYVVLDVPRSDTAVLDALDTVKTVVLVVNQEVATVRSAGRMAAALGQRYGTDRVEVVMTRYDERSQIRRQDVERVIARPVSHVFPNDYPTAIASLNNGRPLVLDGQNKLAAAFKTFAQQLAELPDERARQDKPSGLFSLIGGGRR